MKPTQSYALAFAIIVRYSFTHNTLPPPSSLPSLFFFNMSTVTPVVLRRLSAAAERAGTRTISPAPGDKEDTAEIVTLPTVVTFQPGTAVGSIFTRRSVVTHVTPGLISDFVVDVFHHNAYLRLVVVRFNNTAIDKVRSALEPYVPKGKGDKCHTSYYIGEGEGGSLLFATGKPSPSEMQQRAYSGRGLDLVLNHRVGMRLSLEGCTPSWESSCGHAMVVGGVYTLF